MTIGIYKIENLVNGKTYIGSSINIEQRWSQHRWFLNTSSHHSPHLQRSFDKYGQDKFSFEILQELEFAETLLVVEQVYFSLYKPEYNVLPIAGSPKSRKLTEETRKKMSDAKKGKPHSQETREKMSNSRKGRTHSEEHRKSMSLSRIGKKHPKSRTLKSFIGIDPEGNTHYFTNVSGWAEQRGLKIETIYRVASGKHCRPIYKGWKFQIG